ncbi:MAG: tRNA glutamyl-Q(34) synthetase GluQRS, partial [Pseudomonadota bacterium]
MLHDTAPVLRFAPSPNGALHLGHALSAFVNRDWANALGGRLLLRMEDIDTTRCTEALADKVRRDLNWLGVTFDEEAQAQSQRFRAYEHALRRLREMGLVYASFLSRGAIKRMVAERPDWPRDPDGSPHYPGDERTWSEVRQQAEIERGGRPVWRLDIAKAIERVGPVTWQELSASDDPGVEIVAHPERWGDVVLARADTPTSYHLSVTMDDAAQGITHVVRGKDLRAATDVHRLLQVLLDLPTPLYHHHVLVLGEDGRKLSKSDGSTSLAALRDAGLAPADIRERLSGLRADPKPE